MRKPAAKQRQWIESKLGSTMKVKNTERGTVVDWKLDTGKLGCWFIILDHFGDYHEEWRMFPAGLRPKLFKAPDHERRKPTLYRPHSVAEELGDELRKRIEG